MAEISDQKKSSNRKSFYSTTLSTEIASGQKDRMWISHPAIIGRPKISVVIPTLNKSENLPFVIPEIPDWVHEVILVDGHSKDNTIAIARQLLPNIRVVLQEGYGKGEALRCGFNYATGDIIVMLDADNSTKPKEIKNFVAVLMDGADFAKGSRFLPGGGTADMEWYRRFGNWCFVILVRLGFSCQYTDLCYGYNAFWRRHLPILRLDANGFEIETLMNLRALTAGLKVVEVPSFEDRRKFGFSKLNTISDGWRVLRTIVSEWKIWFSERNSRDIAGRDSVKAYQIDTSGSCELEIHNFLHLALKTVDAATGSLIIIDDEGEIIEACLLSQGQVHSLLVSQVVDIVKEGLAGWVIKNRQAAIVNSTCDDQRWLRRSWDTNECNSRSAISIPLIDTGQVTGVMTLVGSSKNMFTQKDMIELKSIAV